MSEPPPQADSVATRQRLNAGRASRFGWCKLVWSAFIDHLLFASGCQRTESRRGYDNNQIRSRRIVIFCFGLLNIGAYVRYHKSPTPAENISCFVKFLRNATSGLP